jgi:hypothetical protein
MASDEAPQPVEVVLGTAGLGWFLKAYMDAPAGAEITITLGAGPDAAIMLLEVAGKGTMIPAADAEGLAAHLRDFRWVAQGEAMRDLARQIQGAFDMWQAKQGPKH